MNFDAVSWPEAVDDDEGRDIGQEDPGVVEIGCRGMGDPDVGAEGAGPRGAGRGES